MFIPESQWPGVVSGYPTGQHNYRHWSLLQNWASGPGSHGAGEQKGHSSKELGMDYLCLLFSGWTSGPEAKGLGAHLLNRLFNPGSSHRECC